MSKIRIKNFGPVKKGYSSNDGWLDINKVTVFVGNQGSGKSTVAKLISTFTWIEKALVRGDYDIKWFEARNRFKNQFLSYHRLKDYLYSDTTIEYIGDAYSIKYANGLMSITKTTNDTYLLPQIMYVPAERNFLTYIKGAKELKLSSEALQEFNTEYKNSKDNLTGVIRLPINDTDIEYNKQYDNLYLKGDNYRIKITDASSGFQSFVPLYLVSNYLANSVKSHSDNKDLMSVEERTRFIDNAQKIVKSDSLTNEQKRLMISALSAKFNKSAFVNIVEEPEQNLFPSSQWQMLQSLLAFNNINDGNKLIITTHSPYLINYLTIAIKAKQVLDNLSEDKKETLSSAISNLISLDSCVNTDGVSIYEMEEKTGIIKSLPKYNNIIPSDDNFLNNMLSETNNLFAELQEIEEENEN
jgi:predicted ATPase